MYPSIHPVIVSFGGRSFEPGAPAFTLELGLNDIRDFVANRMVDPVGMFGSLS